MYCINCGVKLADSQEACPLCGTVVYHPDIQREKVEALYPKDRQPTKQRRSFVLQFTLLAASLITFVTVLMCDLQLNHAITWSGYVMGALLLGYVSVALPMWFRSPNPVIFVPCSFAATLLYVLYISIVTHGQWFLSFAFPLIGILGLIVTAVVTLLYYLKRGQLFVIGGAMMTLGAVMPLMEFLITITFHLERYIGWSFYPLITLVLLGALLIFFGIYRPAREALKRKFFF